MVRRRLQTPFPKGTWGFFCGSESSFLICSITMGAAFAAHEEKIKGSLEPGKLADVTVWTEDPYALPAGRLYNAAIDLTMVGGKVVYQKT